MADSCICSGRYATYCSRNHAFAEEEEKKCNTVLWVFAIIGAVAAIAGIAYAAYRYFKPDYLEDFEDDFEDEFEDDFFDDDDEEFTGDGDSDYIKLN